MGAIEPMSWVRAPRHPGALEPSLMAHRGAGEPVPGEGVVEPASFYSPQVGEGGCLLSRPSSPLSCSVVRRRTPLALDLFFGSNSVGGRLRELGTCERHQGRPRGLTAMVPRPPRPQPSVHIGLPHCTPSALEHPQRHLTGWNSMEVPIHPPQGCWLPESTVVREFHTWISVLVHVGGILALFSSQIETPTRLWGGGWCQGFLLDFCDGVRNFVVSPFSSQCDWENGGGLSGAVAFKATCLGPAPHPYPPLFESYGSP